MPNHGIHQRNGDTLKVLRYSDDVNGFLREGTAFYAGAGHHREGGKHYPKAIMSTDDPNIGNPETNRELRMHMLAGFFVQFLILILGGLVLDQGETMHTILRVALGYWIGVAIILVRRSQEPSRVDLLFIQWGNLILVVIALPIAFWYWHYRRII